MLKVLHERESSSNTRQLALGHNAAQPGSTGSARNRLTLPGHGLLGQTLSGLQSCDQDGYIMGRYSQRTAMVVETAAQV